MSISVKGIGNGAGIETIISVVIGGVMAVEFSSHKNFFTQRTTLILNGVSPFDGALRCGFWAKRLGGEG